MSHYSFSELEEDDELERERGLLFIFFGFEFWLSLSNWERREQNSLWRPLRWHVVEQDDEEEAVSVFTPV